MQPSLHLEEYLICVDNGRRMIKGDGWDQTQDLDFLNSALAGSLLLGCFLSGVSSVACLLVCRAQLRPLRRRPHRLTPSPSPGTPPSRKSRVQSAFTEVIRAFPRVPSMVIYLPSDSVELCVLSSCREGPGVSYALNWALAAAGVTPSGTVSRNLKAAKLAELSKGSAGTPTSCRTEHPWPCRV